MLVNGGLSSRHGRDMETSSHNYRRSHIQPPQEPVAALLIGRQEQPELLGACPLTPQCPQRSLRSRGAGSYCLDEWSAIQPGSAPRDDRTRGSGRRAERR
jgi:hypothetical protein